MGPLAVAVCVSFSLRKCVLEVQNRRFFLDFSLARAYRRSQDWDTRGGGARKKVPIWHAREGHEKNVVKRTMCVSVPKTSLKGAK